MSASEAADGKEKDTEVGRTEDCEGAESTHKPFHRTHTNVAYFGQDANDSKKDVNAPTEILSNVAHIHTPYIWLNSLWLMAVTFLTPAGFALFWFGAIPLGDAEGESKERIVWAFIVNTGTYVFFSFMLVNIFLACLDGNHPWRPFRYYAPILAMNYVLQVGFIGTIVLAHGTFPALGLVAIAISIGTTLLGLHLLPHKYFDCNAERYHSKLAIFRRILFWFALFWLVLLGYILANGNIESSAQGFLTVALSIITFIFKKIFLSLSDDFPLEIAMVISGLWLENIVDLFIAMAYPSATEPGPTFFVIWITRVAENIAYLGFQLDAWFKFRVWIKGKFKPTQREAVEIDEDDDDRGHSNQHPGYRRRQMRFLVWKLLSQFSSTIFFVTVIPLLRYGQNKESYPYSKTDLEGIDTLNDDAVKAFKSDTFEKAMYFAAFSFFTTFCSGVIILWWMSSYQEDILRSLKERYTYLIVSKKYFGFVITVLISNVLLAVSAVQVHNRLYYV